MLYLLTEHVLILKANLTVKTLKLNVNFIMIQIYLNKIIPPSAVIQPLLGTHSNEMAAPSEKRS